MGSSCLSAKDITRRAWNTGISIAFSSFFAAATALPASAQVTSKTPPEGAPAPAPTAATPEQKLQKAYADVHETSERLAKIEIPMDVEPSFTFHP